MDDKALFTGKDEIMDKPVGLKDIRCTLYKNDGKYYIVGNMTDKEEILKRLYADTLDFIAKTQGIDKVEDYIIYKGTGLHSDGFIGTDKKKPNIYAVDYIDTYKDGEKAQNQKETENEMFRDYLSDKLEDAVGLQSTYPDIFEDKCEELAYIWTYHDYDDKLPYNFTQSEVIDLVSFVKDYHKGNGYSKSDELCENAVQSIIDDNNKYVGAFYSHLNSYDPEYLTKLLYEGRAKLDCESLLYDTKEIYNPAEGHILPKADQFIYVLDDNEARAYEFFNERVKNVNQEWEIHASFSFPILSDKHLHEEGIRRMIESQCETDNIHIRRLNIHTPADTRGSYTIDLEADHMVKFYSDPSVGITGEFEGAWEEGNEIKDWLKDTLKLDKDMDLDYTMSYEDYDGLYEKYNELLAPMYEAEEKYLKEMEEREDR